MIVVILNGLTIAIFVEADVSVGGAKTKRETTGKNLKTRINHGGSVAYEYDKVKLVRVVDGDTYYLEVDMGFNIKTTQSFRLKGVDTPETYRPKSEEELKKGQAATAFVKDMFAKAEQIKIKSYKAGVYARWEADVFVKLDGEYKSLAELLTINDLLKDG
jgi:micrococcal nuclease